jgi:hypothetical protein
MMVKDLHQKGIITKHLKTSKYANSKHNNRNLGYRDKRIDTILPYS